MQQDVAGHHHRSVAISVTSHAAILRESPWKGLPELTNKNDHAVQAWSVVAMLDVLYDLEQYKAAT